MEIYKIQILVLFSLIKYLMTFKAAVSLHGLNFRFLQMRPNISQDVPSLKILDTSMGTPCLELTCFLGPLFEVSQSILTKEFGTQFVELVSYFACIRSGSSYYKV